MTRTAPSSARTPTTTSTTTATTTATSARSADSSAVCCRICSDAGRDVRFRATIGRSSSPRRPRVVTSVSARTLGDLLASRAAERPDDEAIVFPAERHTYAELAARATDAARGLLGLGVGPGDRVGILLPASADLLAVLFGATTIGAVAVPVNARFTAGEVAGLVRHSGHGRAGHRRRGPGAGGHAGAAARRRARGPAGRAGRDRRRRRVRGGVGARAGHRGDRLHVRDDGGAEGRDALPRGAHPAPGRHRRADGADAATTASGRRSRCSTEAASRSR